MEENIKFTAPCLFGLESIVKFELSKIGAQNIQPENGRVSFEGDERTLAKASLWLRSAERVYIVLGSFKATTFTQLFDGVNTLPFEKYITENDEFPVKGWSIDSQLESVPSCQSIIKKSIVTRLSQKYNRAQFPENGPLHQIAFSIHKDIATIMIDTTGTALYKRGYRKDANLAPIRETLAAGIVDLARVRENDTIYDPFCGSGTILIEAAQKARNIAPGINRRFSVEEWSTSDDKIWKQEREAAKEQVKTDIKFHAYGFDIDRSIINVAKSNARIAGVDDLITFEYGDVKDFKVKSPSTIITNPPYGERMLEASQASELYQTMGNVFYQKPGVSYYIIGSSEDFEKDFGRKADKRRKLYNGMIPSQLYMYFK